MIPVHSSFHSVSARKSRGWQNRWRTKHARYDKVYRNFDISYFDISKNSIRYPTLAYDTASIGHLSATRSSRAAEIYNMVHVRSTIGNERCTRAHARPAWWYYAYGDPYRVLVCVVLLHVVPIMEGWQDRTKENRTIDDRTIEDRTMFVSPWAQKAEGFNTIRCVFFFVTYWGIPASVRYVLWWRTRTYLVLHTARRNTIDFLFLFIVTTGIPIVCSHPIYCLRPSTLLQLSPC